MHTKWKYGNRKDGRMREKQGRTRLVPILKQKEATPQKTKTDKH